MTAPRRQPYYFYYSLIFHVVVLLVLVLGLDFVSPLPVFENSQQNNIISAVVLGDTPQSRVIPETLTLPSVKVPTPVKVKPLDKPITQVKVKPNVQTFSQSKTIVQKPEVKPEIKKDVIALTVQRQKIAEQKALREKIQREMQQELQREMQQQMLAKDLLSEMKMQRIKQKKVKQKLLQSQSQFQKTLRAESEKSLRQQLFNENIRLQGAKTQLAQGEVNRYKALILQAISQQWLVPMGVDKSLSCQLLIRIAPGGTVLDVQLQKSSGDPALDSSARAAVLKASPLPVPANADAFDAFRQFVLKVKPENVL